MGSSFFQLEHARLVREGQLVFDNLSLSLEAGSHTAILGPNGSGKSSLLKLIYRELYPSALPESRMLTFGKERINAWELRRRCGLVSSDLQYAYPQQTAALDVVLSAYSASLDLGANPIFGDKERSRALELLSALDASHLSARAFGSLSTGEKRRVLLARALVHNPEILLLDEPTSGLDLNGRFEFFERLHSFLCPGRTVLLITHHIEEIPPEIEDLIFLKEGESFDKGGALIFYTPMLLVSFLIESLKSLNVGGSDMPYQKRRNNSKYLYISLSPYTLITIFMLCTR